MYSVKSGLILTNYGDTYTDTDTDTDRERK